MKRILTVAAAMVLVMGIGTAFADQMPGVKDVGAGPYNGIFKLDSETRSAGMKGAAPGGIRHEVTEEKAKAATDSYNILFGKPRPSELTDVL